jgi:CO/xanthine dehydrogenase Mo-binding subunit
MRDDEVAEALKMDPLDFRLKNAAKEGTKAAHGPVFRASATSRPSKPRRTRSLQAPAQQVSGQGAASGFWFNAGGPILRTS